MFNENNKKVFFPKTKIFFNILKKKKKYSFKKVPLIKGDIKKQPSTSFNMQFFFFFIALNFSIKYNLFSLIFFNRFSFNKKLDLLDLVLEKTIVLPVIASLPDLFFLEKIKVFFFNSKKDLSKKFNFSNLFEGLNGSDFCKYILYKFIKKKRKL